MTLGYQESYIEINGNQRPAIVVPWHHIRALLGREYEAGDDERIIEALRGESGAPGWLCSASLSVAGSAAKRATTKAPAKATKRATKKRRKAGAR